MCLYRFTGNPFVDAGIAGMCAAAEVDRPEDLSYENVRSATQRLVGIFTSPQALKCGVGPGNSKASAFATREMSVFFPNGPLANPSNNTAEKKREKYSSKINELLSLLNLTCTSSMRCFVCGRYAHVVATKMDFPLVDSSDRRNFHPAHNPGHPVCAHCALAVQFLPISTMRTSPNGGLFWFLSSLDPRVAIAPAAELVLPELNNCIALNNRLRLYGDWEVPGKTSSAVVSALVALSGKQRLLNLSEPEYPVRAFFFTNDNRNPRVSILEIPNYILRFIVRLRSIHRDSFNKFVNEALRLNGLCDAMLEGSQIAKKCVVFPDNENNYTELKGGWYAHALYMKEVLGMQDRYIKTIEDVALRIAESEDPLAELKSIKVEKWPIQWFHRAIAKSFLTFDEFCLLVPENYYRNASVALDYVTAATADAIRCKTENGEWKRWDGCARESENNKHPIIQLVENIGDRVSGSSYDPKKLLNNLRIARDEFLIRRAWLRALESGAIGWTDFVELVPPDNSHIVFTVRDYMIAYLCDKLRGSIEPEAIEESEEAPDINLNIKNNNIEEEEEWPTL